MVEWTRKEEGKAFPAVKPDADWIAALTQPRKDRICANADSIAPFSSFTQGHAFYTTGPMATDETRENAIEPHSLIGRPIRFYRLDCQGVLLKA